MADAASTPGGSSAEAPPRQRRRARWALLVLALAALASSWNPVGAPFALIVGVVAAALAVRALRRTRAPRRLEAAALASSVVAIVASAIVIVLTAGAIGVELPGQPIVKGRTQAELDQVLSEAGERTRARRERALQELESLAPGSRDTAPRTPPPPNPGTGGEHDRDRP